MWDSTRAQPPAGAEVYLADDERSAVSGGEGRFTLDSVPVGTQEMADMQTLRVTTDARGRYIACGVPRGVLPAAQAAMAGESGAIRRTEVPRGDIVVLDLDLEPMGAPPPETHLHRRRKGESPGSATSPLPRGSVWTAS